MDGLRGVAAIGVMLYHYTCDRSGGLLPSGPFAVDVFFCLSGFVIAFGYADRLDDGFGFANFARARLIRLYPMYFAGLLLGLANYFAAARAGGGSNPTGLVALAIVNGLVLLPTFQPIAIGLGAERTNRILFPFNGASWSLFDELLCNALFAVFRPRGPRLALTIAVALGLLFVTTLAADGPASWGWRNWWAGPPRALFSFYLGVALHDLWRQGRLDIRLGVPLLPALVVVAAMATPDRVSSYLVLAFIVGPVSVALSIEGPGDWRLRRLFEQLGALSYPLYAINMPALGLMRLSYNALAGQPAASIPPLAAHFGFAAVTVSASVLLAAWVDPPARRWMGAWWPPKASGAALGRRDAPALEAGR